MSKNSLRALFVNPYGIGDVLFVTPLLKAFREKYPEAFVGFLVGSRTKEVLEFNPYVDKIFVYDKSHMRSLSKWKQARYFTNLVYSLRQKNFDVLFDFSLGREYASMAQFLLGIRKRIGFDLKGRGAFLNHKVKIPGFREQHVARYYLELGKFIGVDPNAEEGVRDLSFFISKDGLRRAEDLLREKGLSADQKLVLMIPGGGASWGRNGWYKQWPTRHFAELADKITNQYGAQVLLTGDKGDEGILNEVKENMKSKPMFFDQLDLATFAGLMSYCRLVICNDGGPLHVAVSQGISTLSFFGPVNEKVYGPYSSDPDHQVFTEAVSCRPCYQHPNFPPCTFEKACLVKLDPKQVFQEAKPLLDKKLTLQTA